MNDLNNAWKLLVIVVGGAHKYSVWQRLKIGGMWLFLGPLIVILGLLDILTGGRSRNWP